MEKEIWKTIKNYEGLYQISNKGNVKSLGRWVYYKNKGKRWQEEKILKNHKDKDGYLIVVLCKEGKQKTFKVHRLVAQAFIPNPNNLPQVNHKDENKENNFVYINEDGTADLEKSNLEWCTNEYNHNYGTRNKRMAEKQKGNTRGSKPVIQIDKHTNEVINEWISASEAQRQLGIQSSSISQCCTNYPGHKSAGGYKWKYKEVS